MNNQIKQPQIRQTKLPAGKLAAAIGIFIILAVSGKYILSASANKPPIVSSGNLAGTNNLESPSGSKNASVLDSEINKNAEEKSTGTVRTATADDQSTANSTLQPSSQQTTQPTTQSALSVNPNSSLTQNTNAASAHYSVTGANGSDDGSGGDDGQSSHSASLQPNNTNSTVSSYESDDD